MPIGVEPMEPVAFGSGSGEPVIGAIIAVARSLSEFEVHAVIAMIDAASRVEAIPNRMQSCTEIEMLRQSI
jgi:hypothetical protein